jgi:hypothetical protein
VIFIAGKTWEHKERLKDMGARWDGVNRQWNTYRLTDQDRQEISTWVGVTIAEPPSAEIVDIDDDYDELIKPVKTGTKIFGDDQSWFNYFAGQNPTSFFGFSSLSAMVKYVKAVPKEQAVYCKRGWDTTEQEWFGTPNMNAVGQKA